MLLEGEVLEASPVRVGLHLSLPQSSQETLLLSSLGTTTEEVLRLQITDEPIALAPVLRLARQHISMFGYFIQLLLD